MRPPCAARSTRNFVTRGKLPAAAPLLLLVLSGSIMGTLAISDPPPPPGSDDAPPPPGSDDSPPPPPSRVPPAFFQFAFFNIPGAYNPKNAVRPNPVTIQKDVTTYLVTRLCNNANATFDTDDNCEMPVVTTQTAICTEYTVDANNNRTLVAGPAPFPLDQGGAFGDSATDPSFFSAIFTFAPYAAVGKHELDCYAQAASTDFDPSPLNTTAVTAPFTVVSPPPPPPNPPSPPSPPNPPSPPPNPPPSPPPNPPPSPPPQPPPSPPPNPPPSPPPNPPPSPPPNPPPDPPPPSPPPAPPPPPAPEAYVFIEAVSPNPVPYDYGTALLNVTLVGALCDAAAPNGMECIGVPATYTIEPQGPTARCKVCPAPACTDGPTNDDAAAFLGLTATNWVCDFSAPINIDAPTTPGAYVMECALTTLDIYPTLGPVDRTAFTVSNPPPSPPQPPSPPSPPPAPPPPPSPPPVLYGFTRITNLAPNPLVSGNTSATFDMEAVLCTTDDESSCFDNSTLRLPSIDYSARCKICDYPIGRRKLLGSAHCDVPVTDGDNCYWLDPAGNTTDAFERIGAPLDWMNVPSTPGDYLLECALRAFELPGVGQPTAVPFQVVAAPPPPPPAVPYGFMNISSLAPTVVTSGTTLMTAELEAVLCTANTRSSCFSNSTLRLPATAPIARCKFCQAHPVRRKLLAPIGCPVPVNTSNAGFTLTAAANATLQYENSNVVLTSLSIPTTPGDYALECALQTSELGPAVGRVALSYFAVVSAPPSPPAKRPPPPPPPAKRPPPPPPKPAMPASCPSAAQYRALGGCRQCVAVDSPFMSYRGGVNRIRCVRPVTTGRTATACSDAVIPAVLTVQTNNPFAPKLACIPLTAKWVTVGLPVRTTAIPFLTPQKIIKKSLRLNQGLLPVTDRNGVPISTIKKQDGNDFIFFTFEAPAGGLRNKRGATISVTGAVARGGTGTFALNWCFTADVKVCSK